MMKTPDSSKEQNGFSAHNREHRIFKYDDEMFPKKTEGPLMIKHISKPSDPSDSRASILERYSSSLGMLNGETLKCPTFSNIDFIEDDSPACYEMFDENKRTMDSTKVEKELALKSTVYLKRMLEIIELMPRNSAVEVLSDSLVIARILDCNSSFSFGLKRDLPSDDMDESLINTVKIATKLFNGSCIPLVLWPLDELKYSSSYYDKNQVPESTIFDAIQIYCLRKHNRKIYVELGRNAPLSHDKGGILPLDVMNSSILREISDVILDELLAGLWSIEHLINLYLKVRDSGDTELCNILKFYCDLFKNDSDKLAETLWNRYVSYTDHLRDRIFHLQNIDTSLHEKINSRLLVEVNQILVLQNAILRTLLAIHHIKGCDTSTFGIYFSTLKSQGFAGVFNLAGELLGPDVFLSSPTIINNVYELQCTSTLLISSFYFFNTCKDLSTSRELSEIHEELMMPLMNYWRDAAKNDGELELDVEEADILHNRSVPILFFTHCSFISKIPASELQKMEDGIDKNSARLLLTRSSKHLGEYSNAMEWICNSRHAFTTESSLIMNKVLLESFISLVSCRPISSIKGYVEILFGLGRVVDSNRDFTELITELLEHFTQQFPFSINTIFHLLNAFLPLSDDFVLNEDLPLKSNDRLRIVLNLLTSNINTISIPLDALSSGPSSFTGAPENAGWANTEALVSPSPISETPVEGTKKGSLQEKCQDDYAPSDETVCDQIVKRNVKEHSSESYASFVTTETLSIEIQLLSSVGIDAGLLANKWHTWELGNCLYCIPKGSTGRIEGDAIDGKYPLDTKVVFDLNRLHVLVLNATDGGGSIINGKVNFNLLRCIWVTWRGLIAYIENTMNDLPLSALEVLVVCNSLLSRLLTNFPSFFYLLESHIKSTMYSRFGSKYPFGSYNVLYHYVLLFYLALKRNQLRVMLPEIVKAMSSILLPTYVIPAGENRTDVTFYRYWIFFQSLHHIMESYCTMDNNMNVFTMLLRVLHEEEKPIRTYPVTREVLKFFRELLCQCPPEFWILPAIHHGLWNLANSSLDVSSGNITSIGVNYLRSLSSYLKNDDKLYSPFQSFLLCEMFTYALKSVGVNIHELDFINVYERYEMMEVVLDIVLTICRIFRLSNYNLSWKFQSSELEWLHGLDELVNQLLLALSESNYISEVVRILSSYLDIVNMYRDALGSRLVVVNPLKFSEATLSFFTLRLADNKTALLSKCYTRNAHYSPAHRWLSIKCTYTTEYSERIIEKTLNLLSDLSQLALPKVKSVIYNTIGVTLGGDLFNQSKLSEFVKTGFLISEDAFDMNDPIVYYSITQMKSLNKTLPRLDLFDSISHMHTFIKVSTDVMTLHLLLNELYCSKKANGSVSSNCVDYSHGCIRGLWTGRVKLIESLGALKNNTEVIAMVNKEDDSVVEYLLAIFFNPAICGYKERISILQYLTTLFDTKKGMELLLENTCVTLRVIYDFIDSVISRFLNNKHVSLGDVIIIHLTLLLFNFLLKVYHVDNWDGINSVLRKLVSVWIGLDSPSIYEDVRFDYTPTFVDYNLGLESNLNYSINLSVHSVYERKVALLKLLSSIFLITNIISTCLETEKYVNNESFLNILSYISLNWEFVDALFPVTAYDYYSSDNRNAKNYRVGLLFDECNYLEKCFEFVNALKIPKHLILHDRYPDITECSARNLLKELSLTISANPLGVNEKTGHVYSTKYTFNDIISELVGEVANIPELNAIPHYCGRNYGDNKPTTDHFNTCEFFCFNTIENYGFNYTLDIYRFIYICTVLSVKDTTTTRNIAATAPTIENVKYFAKMSSFISSMNDLKFKLLCLFHKLIHQAKGVKLVKSNLRPFDNFVINVSMSIQLMLLSSLQDRYPLHLGLLVKILVLTIDRVDFNELLKSFDDYIGMKDSSEFIINIFGGFIVLLSELVKSNISILEQLAALAKQDNRERLTGSNRSFERLLWLIFVIFLSYGGLYRSFTRLITLSPKLPEVLKLYKEVAHCVILNFYKASQYSLTLIMNENDHLHNLYSDLQENISKEEFNNFYLLTLSPCAALLPLKHVMKSVGGVINEVKEDLTFEDQVYDSVFVLIDLLASQIATSSVLMPNSTKVYQSDRSYLISCLDSSGVYIRYNNNNWLCTTLYNCLDSVISIMISSCSSLNFREKVIKSHVISKFYHYPFLNHFLQPLSVVNPKASLIHHYIPNYNGSLLGSCVNVLDDSISRWYPCYLMDNNSLIHRCSYHLLHCKLLSLIYILDDFHALNILTILHDRIKSLLKANTLAHMEEWILYLSLIERFKDWHKMPKNHLKITTSFLSHLVKYFSNLISHFQNGLYNISHHIKPTSLDELTSDGNKGIYNRPRTSYTTEGSVCPSLPSGIYRVESPKDNFTREHNSGTVPNDASSKETGERGSATKDFPSSSQSSTDACPIYKQRLLYLLVKSVDIYIDHLLDLGITMDVGAELPPTSDKLIRCENIMNRSLVSVKSYDFSASSAYAEQNTGGSTNTPPVTLETLLLIENNVVELGTLMLRLLKELKTSRMTLTTIADGNTINVLLNLGIRVVEGADFNIINSIKCAIYTKFKVTRDIYSPVPAAVKLDDFVALVEKTIERTLLFAARFVNTLYLQNQLSDYLNVTTRIGGSDSININSSTTLLNALFSDVINNKQILSESTHQFAKVLFEFISKRITDSKALFDKFNKAILTLDERSL